MPAARRVPRRLALSARRRFTVALVAVLGVFGLTTAAQAAEGATGGATGLENTDHYVALGDSFAAGPLIPPQRAEPIGCGRSESNYPTLLARDLGLEGEEFVDVSCSSAVTDNMTVAQEAPFGGVNPPQFDALRADTDLVTVSISGNDIGFADIVLTCARLGARDPLGDPCRRHATAGGTDAYAERILAAAPKLAGVLEGIEQRSPDAQVVVVGYLRILPPSVGCWPVVPISRGDVPYLDGLQQQLTSMMATQADRHGALFVDAYANSLNRDACQPRDRKWVEGIFPTSPAYPVHPNAAGMRAVADLTLRTLTESLD